MWRESSTGLAALLLAGTLTLTACGGSDPASSGKASSTPTATKSTLDPSAVVRAAAAAAEQAKTYRLRADGTDAGKPLKLDLHYGANGVDGSVVMAGTSLQIEVVGKTVYFKAPSKFWREQGGAQGDAVARMYGDRWVRTSSSSAFGKGFGEFADKDSFLDEFTKGFTDDDLKEIKQVGTSTVDGTATNTFTDDTDDGTIDVAATGTPYPLKVVTQPGSSEGDAGTVTLTDWDQSYTVRAPKTFVPLPG